MSLYLLNPDHYIIMWSFIYCFICIYSALDKSWLIFKAYLRILYDGVFFFFFFTTNDQISGNWTSQVMCWCRSSSPSSMRIYFNTVNTSVYRTVNEGDIKRPKDTRVTRKDDAATYSLLSMFSFGSVKSKREIRTNPSSVYLIPDAALGRTSGNVLIFSSPPTLYSYYILFPVTVHRCGWSTESELPWTGRFPSEVKVKAPADYQLNTSRESPGWLLRDSHMTRRWQPDARKAVTSYRKFPSTPIQSVRTQLTDVINPLIRRV